MQQYPAYVSDRNSPKTSGEKSRRCDLHSKSLADVNGSLATESLMVPKSGIRRNSIHLNVFNKPQNASHIEAVRTQPRSRWQRVKGLLGKQLPKESLSMDNNNCSSLNSNDDSYFRHKEDDEVICMEEYFQRGLAVTALPEETSSDSTITFVSRSFEVNLTAGERWSSLKEAVLSGKIVEKMEEEEKSGLRRLSLVPTKGVTVRMEPPNVSRGPHSGWLKMKRLLGRKVPSQASKYGTVYNEDRSYSNNEIGESACRDTPDELHRGIEEDFYAVIDSPVQALPSDVVSKSDIVSVTRSFEYHGNWQKVRNMLTKQDENQEGHVCVSDEDHKSSSKVKANSVENSVVKKDAYCQTEVDLEKVFQHQINKNLTCGVCGSKYEEKCLRRTEGNQLHQNKANLNEGKVGGHSSRKQQEKSNGWEKKKNSENTYEEHEATSNGMRLVADMLQHKILTTKLEDDGDEEVGGTPRTYYHERKEVSPGTKKTESGFYEVSNLIDTNEECDDGFLYNNKNIKRENEEFPGNRGVITEKCDTVVCKVYDSGGFNSKKNCKDHQNEFQTPECQSVRTATEKCQTIVLEEKVKEASNVMPTSQCKEEKDVISCTGFPMSSSEVRAERVHKEGRSPRVPVMVTAKVLEREQPLVEQVKLVRVLTNVHVQPWDITYV